MDSQRNCRETILMVLTVIGGFLILFSIGGAYSYDTIFNQHYNETNTNSATIQINQTLDIFGVGMFGLSASMGLGGYISTKYGHRITIFIGSLIMNFGIAITKITPNNWYLVTYGFVCGSGAGLMLSVSLATASQWFKFHKSFILSIVFSGFSFGSILDDLTIKYKTNWSIFFVIAIEFFIIQIFGLLLMQAPKENSSENENLIQSDNDSEQAEDIEPHIMIMEFDFWIIWQFFNLNAFGINYINLLYQIEKPILNSYQNNTMSAHIFSLFNVVGQVIWGISSDHAPMNIVFPTFALGSSFIYGVFILFGENKYLFMIYPARFFQSGILVVIPGLILKRFGQRYFATNYGITWTAYTFAGIIISQLPIFMNRSVAIPMSIFSVTSFISFILILFYGGKSKRVDKIFFMCRKTAVKRNLF